MALKKYILHVDMDAFFASCEEAVNPSLKGKPLIVGGTPDDIRGIVSCPNYQARAKGVKTAMPIAQAYQLVPEGNFIRGTRGIYSDYSKKVREIFFNYTPLVEPMSIDEAFLDVTEVLRPYKGDVKKLAFDLKEEIKRKLKITCSIGISSNKVCSKIASKENKPDGITYIEPGKEMEFLSNLSIKRIPGVGKETYKKLIKYDILTIGDIHKYDEKFYDFHFGISGRYLLNTARGIGKKEIETFEDYEQKSLSKETTLDFDTNDKAYLEKELYYVLERACARMRKHNYVSRSITVKVKYSDFTINQKATLINRYSNIEMDFYETAISLFEKLYYKTKNIRLIGVRFGDLNNDTQDLQEDFFRDEEKYSRLVKNMDSIRKKYTFDILKFGKTFDNKKN